MALDLHDLRVRSTGIVWLAGVGLLLLAIAALGSFGRLYPEACNDEFLSRNASGVSVERSWLPTGYTCTLSFADRSTDVVTHESWLPPVAAPIGLVLIVTATDGHRRARLRTQAARRSHRAF